MHRCVGVVTGSISGDETPPLRSGRLDPGHRNAIPNPNARDVAKGRAEASRLDPDLARHDTLRPDFALTRPTNAPDPYHKRLDPGGTTNGPMMLRTN